jgi:dihydroxyacetone kinase-like protein
MPPTAPTWGGGLNSVLVWLNSVSGEDIATILKGVGMALVSTTGGAGGPIYRTFFLQAGAVAAGKTVLTPQDRVAAMEAGLPGIVNGSRAQPGDKTTVDTLFPASQALPAVLGNGSPLALGLTQSASAAQRGMKGALTMVAKKVRASYLGERSAAPQESGATSFYLMLQAASEAWADAPSAEQTGSGIRV